MIPLIYALLRTDAEVILASKGKAGELLKTEFPDLPFYDLPSVHVRYSRRRSQALILAFQIPLLLISICKEHRWLKKFTTTHPLDIVISDNCYGLFNSRILSVFLSHQISPLFPAGFKWMESFVHAVLGLFIRSFDRCWIPDDKDPSLNLTGRLSHRYPVFRNTVFMGILSRFCELPDLAGKENIKKVDILVILSGPEPQRTLMEEIMIRQLAGTDYKAMIVCGMQHSCRIGNEPVHPASIDCYYHLPTGALRKAMRNAGIIICRSGYSTIMDLTELGLSAILVPTPGQPEQEYLARYLSCQGFFYCVDQQNFNLQAAIEQYRSQNKKPSGIFRTDTGNYLKDLFTLYENKKIHHRQPDKETGQNLWL
jgi:hypothetical protein